MKSLKVLLVVLDVLLFTSISLAQAEKEPPQGKNILLYATRDWGSPPLRLAFDEDLPSILAQDCFSVTVEDRQSLPILSAAILENYDQLWFVSTEWVAILSAEEVQAILDFHTAGKGILVIGDGCWYTVPANQFSPSLGVQFVSSQCCDCDHCGGPVSCEISTAGFTPHKIWDGVSTIQANQNEGDLTASSPAQVIASDNAINMVAVRDADGGRVAWDATWYRFTDSSYYPDASIRHCDNAQYVRNLANWLVNFLCSDANGDGVINSADVVYLINYLFVGGPAPDPFLAGDANCDCKIDIADVVYLINYLYVGGPPPLCGKTSMSSYGAPQSLNKDSKPATVGLGQMAGIRNGSIEIPLEAEFGMEVAGLQLEINYDPRKVILLEPSLTARTQGLQLYSHVKNGLQKIGIIGISGQNHILPGEGPLVTLRAKGSDLSSLVIKEAILVDRDAHTIPVEIVKTITTTEAHSVPQDFCLVQNYPNPFNPATRIQFTVVSGQFPVPTTLKIYNISGQLV